LKQNVGKIKKNVKNVKKGQNKKNVKHILTSYCAVSLHGDGYKGL